MNIALDYDGTYTSDPELWLRFVIDAQAAGHDIRVVTMRYPSEGADMDKRLAGLGVVTVFTSRKAKEPHCAQVTGWTPHVWIDDNPKAVHMHASEIWATSAPEGSPVVPTYG